MAASDRAVRGACVAVVGVTVAVAAHGSAGAAMVLPAALGCAVIATAACTAVGTRAWTPARLIGALLAIQVLVHGALAIAEPSGAVDPRLAALATTAHAHSARTAELTPTMLLAHAVAVLVAGLLLAGAERAVVAVRALLTLVVVLLEATPPATPGPLRVALSLGSARLRRGVLASAPRRGPPAVLAAS